MKGKKFIAKFIPPILMDVVSRGKSKPSRIQVTKGQISWYGDFETWTSATDHCQGYQDQSILSKVRESLLKVKNGEAVFERDSVLFDTVQYRWPMLACLEHVALVNKGKLSILDFGGSLGSSYYQNRTFLTSLTSLQWVVVEQQHFVECGRRDFADDALKFEETVENAIAKYNPNCLLLSGVVQYLEQPDSWLKSLLGMGIEYVIFDRTGLIKGERDYLTIQDVPSTIYEAKYPCWFFSEVRLKNVLSEKYDIVVEFDDVTTPPISVDNKDAFWKGFFLKRKP